MRDKVSTQTALRRIAAEVDKRERKGKRHRYTMTGLGPLAIVVVWSRGTF